MRFNNKNVILPAPWVQPGPANDELWYTSSDGNIVTPYQASSLPEIDTNTYSDGKGVIKFKTDITNIGYRAFRGCSSLTSVTIPNSVTSIGYRAFDGCSSLTFVEIPNSVTSSVTSIENQAFYNCSSLTFVEIPNSVTNIGDYAFYHCSSLTYVAIGNGVTSIGRSAFDGCSGLTSITYTGTIAQYNSITKGIYWKDGVPATVVHCTDGDAPI